MANIAEAAVLIKANAKAMDSGLREAQGKLQSFAGTAAKMFAGIAIGATLVAAVRRATELGGQVKDLAENFNISAESASGLSFAAEQVGISTATLATNIGRVSKALGEAIGGSSQAQQIFTDMGLSWESLANMPTDQVFRQVIGSLGEMTNVAQRSAAAQAVFGKSWQEVMELVRGGSGGLDDAARRANELGLVWSSEQLERLEQYKRSVNEVGLAFAGLGKTILDAFGEEIKDVLKGAADTIAFISRNLRELRELADRPPEAGGFWDTLGRSVGDEVDTFLEALGIGGASDARAFQERQRSRISPGGLANLGAGAFTATTLTANYVTRAQRAADRAAARDAAQRQVEAAQELMELWESLEGPAAPPAFDFANLIRQADQLTQSLLTPLEKYEQQLELIEMAWLANLISVETYERALVRLNEVESKNDMRLGAGLGAGSVGAADVIANFQNKSAGGAGVVETRAEELRILKEIFRVNNEDVSESKRIRREVERLSMEDASI